MATTAPEAAATVLVAVPLKNLEASPMNPRKRFDEKGLAELADSIRAKGILEPLVVRPKDSRDWKGVRDPQTTKFEIVVGERRYRAAKLAGLREVPALVRALTNAEALEVMVIENLQREDVHPLEEALGYHALLRKTAGDGFESQLKHTVESIAKKVGKSESYVYQRLKLTSLVPIAQEYFQENLLTPGHAVLIARLQPDDQVRALYAVIERARYQPVWGSVNEPVAKLEKYVRGELEQHRQDRADELKAVAKGKDVDPDMGPRFEHDSIMPEKALRNWIRENIQLDLKKAAWKLDDPDLVPHAGACTVCPKRAGTLPALFADLTTDGDTCMDAACYQEKRKAFIKLETVLAKEKGQTLVKLSEAHSYTKPTPGTNKFSAGQWLDSKKGSCEGTVEGIFVDGDEAGRSKFVCVDPKCKTHAHRFQQESLPEQREANRAKEKAKSEAQQALLKAILAKSKGLGRLELELVVASLIDAADISSEGMRVIGEYMGWPEAKKQGFYALASGVKKHKPTPAELARLAFAVTVATFLDWPQFVGVYGKSIDLGWIAGQMGLDPKKVTKPPTSGTIAAAAKTPKKKGKK